MTRNESRMFVMVEAGSPCSPQFVDEVLEVAAMDLRELVAAERRDDICTEQLLIATGGRRLVGLGAAVEDRAVVRAGDQDLGGLGDRLRGRRSHRAAAQRDLRILAPELRRGQRGEGPPHLTAGPRVVRLRLVARRAREAPALTGTGNCERDVCGSRLPSATDASGRRGFS
jgi:hypothetical protein